MKNKGDVQRSDHALDNNKENSLSMNIETEPRFPWEVPVTQRQSDEINGQSGADGRALHFAESGKIDILAKINSLRRQMISAFRERDELKNRVTELQKQCEQLREQLSCSMKEVDRFHERQETWEREKHDLLSKISEIRQKMSALKAERDDLAKQVDIASAAMEDITNALDLSDIPSDSTPKDDISARPNSIDNRGEGGFSPKA